MGKGSAKGHKGKGAQKGSHLGAASWNKGPAAGAGKVGSKLPIKPTGNYASAAAGKPVTRPLLSIAKKPVKPVVKPLKYFPKPVTTLSQTHGKTYVNKAQTENVKQPYINKTTYMAPKPLSSLNLRKIHHNRPTSAPVLKAPKPANKLMSFQKPAANANSTFGGYKVQKTFTKPVQTATSKSSFTKSSNKGTAAVYKPTLLALPHRRLKTAPTTTSSFGGQKVKQTAKPMVAPTTVTPNRSIGPPPTKHFGGQKVKQNAKPGVAGTTTAAPNRSLSAPPTKHFGGQKVKQVTKPVVTSSGISNRSLTAPPSKHFGGQKVRLNATPVVAPTTKTPRPNTSAAPSSSHFGGQKVKQGYAKGSSKGYGKGSGKGGGWKGQRFF